MLLQYCNKIAAIQSGSYIAAYILYRRLLHIGSIYRGENWNSNDLLSPTSHSRTRSPSWSIKNGKIEQ